MSLKTSYEPYTNTSSRTRKLGRPGKTIFQSLEFEHLKLEFKLSNSLRLESWIHASIVNTDASNGIVFLESGRAWKNQGFDDFQI